jgi:hypothetical protein
MRSKAGHIFGDLPFMANADIKLKSSPRKSFAKASYFGGLTDRVHP